MTINERIAFENGYSRGRAWNGPNGDGSLGIMSAGFVRETAERDACGYEFHELRDGPTAQEMAEAEAYMCGFNAGLLRVA